MTRGFALCCFWAGENINTLVLSVWAVPRLVQWDHFLFTTRHPVSAWPLPVNLWHAGSIRKQSNRGLCVLTCSYGTCLYILSCRCPVVVKHLDAPLPCVCLGHRVGGLGTHASMQGRGGLERRRQVSVSVECLNDWTRVSGIIKGRILMPCGLSAAEGGLGWAEKRHATPQLCFLLGICTSPRGLHDSLNMYATHGLQNLGDIFFLFFFLFLFNR